MPPVENKAGERARILRRVIGTAILIFLLPPSIYYFVQLGVPSLPAWLSLAALHYANLHLFRIRRTRGLGSPNTLASITKIEIEGQKVRWHVDASSTRKRANPDIGLMCGALAVATFAGLLLNFQYGRGSFDSLVWGMWLIHVDILAPVSAVAAGAIAAGILVFVHLNFKVAGRLKSAVEDKVRPIVDGLNATIEASAGELEALAADIQQLSSQLQISFPTAHQSELHGLLELHKADVLADTRSLNEHLQRILERARQDREELQKAHDIFQAADTLFTEASKDVNKTRLMPLVRELDQLYYKLTSRDLRSLLETRSWSDYHQAIGSVAEDMKRLRNLTDECFPQKEKRSLPPPTPIKETDEEKAFRILRLPSNASREHMQKAYRWLAAIWHPDSGMVKDDTEIKAINWAYRFLTRSKNLRQ